MAARRLLVVLLILIGISTLAAFLAPTQRRTGTTESTGTASTPRAPPALAPTGSGGRLLKATIDADSENVAVVPLHVDDELSLRVRSSEPGQIEVPAFGLIEAVSEDTPATFDLFFERPGTYAVKLVETNRIAGKLVVRAHSDGGRATAAD